MNKKQKQFLIRMALFFAVILLAVFLILRVQQQQFVKQEADRTIQEMLER